MSGLDAEIAQRMRAKYDPELEQKALNWIGSIVGVTAPVVSGQDGDALFAWLKNGVILCKLLNCIKPGTVSESKITLNPRHVLEERENINLYLGGCMKLGIASQDMCLLADLHSKKSIPAVLNNIYALGRQAQVTSTFKGPRLGVKYSISIEEQERRLKKKEEERQTAARHRRMKSDSQLRRRNELEQERRTEAIDTYEKRETRKLTRKLSKGRISLAAFRQKSFENVNTFKKLRTSSSDLTEMVPEIKVKPVKYGMDLEIEKKRDSNYNVEKEEQVMDWIEAVTGKQVEDFYTDLKDGKTLCELINTIRPNLIRRVNTHRSVLADRDNIQLYLEACRRLGVGMDDLFGVSDLYEQKDLSMVVNHFFALSRQVERLNIFSGPFLQMDGSLSESEDTKEPLLAPEDKYTFDDGTFYSEEEEDKEVDKDVDEEVDYTSKEITFPKTSYLSMITPRFLIRSLFHTIISLKYCFIRG